MIKIFLVEDEENVAEPLKSLLKNEGFAVRLAMNCQDAKSYIKSFNPDIIVLDWMLPDGNGLDLLKTWRSMGLGTPVIMLTARSDTIDKVVGLEVGADDYLTKPFEPRELIARIRARLRGLKNTQQDIEIFIGSVVMKISARTVARGNSLVKLTKLEFDLLRQFMESPGRSYSREELLNKVWGLNSHPSTRTVDTHILQLRSKFPELCFETVHGVGYRLKPVEDS